MGPEPPRGFPPDASYHLPAAPCPKQQHSTSPRDSCQDPNPVGSPRECDSHGQPQKATLQRRPRHDTGPPAACGHKELSAPPLVIPTTARAGGRPGRMLMHRQH
jgi:hypothetical protein